MLKVYFLLYFFHYHLSPYILFHLQPLPPTPHDHHTVVCVHESFFFFTLSLHLPRTLPLSAQSCQPALSLSINLSLFCLLVQAVYWIPHMSELIWYLSFSDWLIISLSIMFSRSIHVAAKGKIFFLYFNKLLKQKKFKVTMFTLMSNVPKFNDKLYFT